MPLTIVTVTSAVAPVQLSLTLICGDAFTVTSTLAVDAHAPAEGVKVYVPLAVLLTNAGDQLPAIPSIETAGKTGATSPLHIAAIAAKVGVVCGLTVTFIVAVDAQLPAEGVKIYVPLAVLLTNAGDQLPEIPLLDVAGNTGATSPLHIAAIAAKVGSICGFTVTFTVAVDAQLPAEGVNVYVPLAVLLTTAGNQLPVMLSIEVAGKIGATSPLHIAAIAAKVGAVTAFTTTTIEPAQPKPVLLSV